MDTNRILAELRAERDRIDQAISALQAINSIGRRRAGRPVKTAAIRGRRGRMSAAARRKLSRLLKQRWAQGRMRPTAKLRQANAPKRARRMSKAARSKIAAAQRARWARVKAQQQTPKKVA
jgi:hypothetical protein